MGLRLPPLMAPIQVVVVPILRKNCDAAAITAAASAAVAAATAAGLRAKLDDDETKSPGFRFSAWEQKGVPIRIEIGPRDLEQGTCVIARRDRPGKEGKEAGVPLEAAALVGRLQKLLKEVQSALLEEAKAFRDSNIRDVTTYQELQAAVAQGFWARGPWAGSDDDERRVKEETAASLRCFPFDQPGGYPLPCLMTGKEAQEAAIFAKAY